MPIVSLPAVSVVRVDLSQGFAVGVGVIVTNMGVGAAVGAGVGGGVGTGVGVAAAEHAAIKAASRGMDRIFSDRRVIGHPRSCGGFEDKSLAETVAPNATGGASRPRPPQVVRPGPRDNVGAARWPADTAGHEQPPRLATEAQMQATAPAGRRAVALTHDGIDRPYLLQAPPAGGSTGERVPLVVELHGRGIDAETFDRLTGFGALAGEEGFALALPSAVGEIWNDGRDAAAEGRRPDDVGYLTAMIDDATAQLPIDPRRIYVVGMSNGATMAGLLACELAERIAAVAQVAGTAAAGVAATCRPARPVPILNIHGTRRRLRPVRGRDPPQPARPRSAQARRRTQHRHRRLGSLLDRRQRRARGSGRRHTPARHHDPDLAWPNSARPTLCSIGSKAGATPGPAADARCRPCSSDGRAERSMRPG